MTKSLSGLKVLITRPKEQGDKLAKLIQREGGESFLWPCLEILPSPNLKNIEAFIQADIFIFVSPNAVSYTFAALSQKNKKCLQETKLIAIGEGTAQALKEQGCLDVEYPEQANSEGLLNLPVLQNVANKNIVIVRGQSGRELIAETLKKRQAKISYLEVYQRKKPDKDPKPLIATWKKEAFDMIIVTSFESLQNLIDILGDETYLLQNTALTVMNEKMLHLATQVGASYLWIDKASNAAVVEYLKRFVHERL